MALRFGLGFGLGIGIDRWSSVLSVPRAPLADSQMVLWVSLWKSGVMAGPRRHGDACHDHRAQRKCHQFEDYLEAARKLKQRWVIALVCQVTLTHLSMFTIRNVVRKRSVHPLLSMFMVRYGVRRVFLATDDTAVIAAARASEEFDFLVRESESTNFYSGEGAKEFVERRLAMGEGNPATIGAREHQQNPKTLKPGHHWCTRAPRH
eukprot:35507-Pyramimonas_sp.AAC.2